MWNMNAISSYILTVALLTLVGLVLVWQRQRTQKTIVAWLASGLAGILLGSIGSFAAVQLGGYELTKIRIQPDPMVVDPTLGEPAEPIREGVRACEESNRRRLGRPIGRP